MDTVSHDTATTEHYELVKKNKTDLYMLMWNNLHNWKKS